MADALELVDGSSLLELVDGSSHLLLEESAGPTEIFAEVSFSAAVTFDASATRTAFGSVSFAPTATLSPAQPNRTTRGTIVPTFRITVDMVAVRVPRGFERRIVIVDALGVPVAEVPESVPKVGFSLNEPDSFSFRGPLSAPAAPLLLDESRILEAQIWQGDRLLTWGPMVSRKPGDGYFEVSGRGADWHLHRRTIGRLKPVDYVENGDFEAGFAGWTATANNVFQYLAVPWAADPPDVEIVTDPHVSGKLALRLEQSVDGADTWVRQAFLWTTDPGANPDGDTFSVKGYVWIDSTEWLAPAFENRGLFLARYSTVELDPDPIVQAVNPGQKKLLEAVIVPIDDDTPRDMWVPLEASLHVPPTGVAETVDVRLYAPQGRVYWDRISLFLDETERFFSVDQALIVEALVEHLQNADYEKSDANIATECPLTGIPRNRAYEHSEHAPGLDAITEFTTLFRGVDVSVRYTPTTRVFRTHFPYRGTVRASHPLIFGKNVSSYSKVFDGELASSGVAVLGVGSGEVRETGVATDPALFDGLTLEEVSAADPETPIESLEELALERLARASAPLLLEVTSTPNAEPFRSGFVGLGDVVPVTIFDQGVGIVLGNLYRIVSLTLNEDETWSASLQRRDPSIEDR